MQPILKQVHPPAPVHVPRSAATALFLHRLKQSLKPHKPASSHVNGHPAIMAPVVVRPKQPVINSSSLY